MTLGCNRNCQQFPHILGLCNVFVATQYEKNLTRGQSVSKSHTGAQYLVWGFEGLQSVTKIQQNFFLH